MQNTNKVRNYIAHLIILLFSIGCGQNTNQDKLEAATDTSTSENDVEEVFEEIELSVSENEIIKALAGNYFSLQKNDDGYIYMEDCSYSEWDVAIEKKLDNVNFWEISFYSTRYDIQEVKQEEELITILAEGKTYTFSKKEMIWEVELPNTQEITALVAAQYLENIAFEPCTEIHKIMDGIPENWYEISEIDGESVVFEPCEDAPGGITINGETIDFWSGSDPYEIHSMTKLYNQISIVYENGLQELDTIIMHDLDEVLFKFGQGNESDRRYAPEEIVTEFPTVNEEC